jgi:hypothetical protein
VETTSPIPQSNSKFWIWTTATLLFLLTAGAFWHFWHTGKGQQMQPSGSEEIAQRDADIAALRLAFQQKQDSLAALLSLHRDSFSVIEIKRLREEVDRKDRMLRDLEAQRRAGKPLIAMQFAKFSDKKPEGPMKALVPRS